MGHTGDVGVVSGYRKGGGVLEEKGRDGVVAGLLWHRWGVCFMRSGWRSYAIGWEKKDRK